MYDEAGTQKPSRLSVQGVSLFHGRQSTIDSKTCHVSFLKINLRFLRKCPKQVFPILIYFPNYCLCSELQEIICENARTARAYFSSGVMLVNGPLCVHPLHRMLDLRGLALCHLDHQGAAKTSGVCVMGGLDCERIGLSRFPINHPRLLGNIIVCITLCIVLLCNAEQCWLVTIPYGKKIIS